MGDSLLSIVTPATASRLTTRDAAKAALGVTGSEQDTQIDAWIDQASAAISTVCRGRVFGVETVRETWRGSEGDWSRYRRRGERDRYGAPLSLARTPVSSVTSITEGPDATALTVDVDYEIDPASGLAWRLICDTRWIWDCRPIVATYTAGWVLPGADGANLPADIESACLDLIARAYYAAGQDTTVQSEQAEGVGRTIYFARPGGALAVDDPTFARLARYALTW